MRRASQAVGRHAFNVAHVLADLGIGLVVLVLLVLGGLTLRLSHGPLSLDRLAVPVIASLNHQGATKIRVGHVMLAWAGWRKSDQPVYLRVQRLEVYQKQNNQEHVLARIDDASVSLSLGRLVLGQLRPRVITIDRTLIHVTRGLDGAITFDLGSLVDQTNNPGSPSLSLRALGLLGGATGSLADLREVRLHDASIGITDQSAAQNMGRNWRIEGADLDFTRGTQGWRGTSTLPLELGADGATKLGITAGALIRMDGSSVWNLNSQAAMTSDLALAAPSLSFLAGVKAPLRIVSSAELTADGTPTQFHVALQLGAGSIGVADGSVPVAGGSAVISGSDHAATLEKFALDLAAPDKAAPKGIAISHLLGSGQFTRNSAGITGALTLDMARVDFADLAEIWPAGAAPGAREWVTNNITAGSARDWHLNLGFNAAPDFSGFTLDKAVGGFKGDDLTISWIKDVPPVTHVHANLSLLDPEHIVIAIADGQQGDGQKGILAVGPGSFDISAITSAQPQGVLALDAKGDLPDLLTLLAVPQLNLLSKHPLGFSGAEGAITAHLGISLPLNSDVPMEQVIINGTLHGTGVHLGQVADGHDLDHATLDLTVNNNGLKAVGKGEFAAIPSDLSYSTDFRDGASNQLLQHATVHGIATPAEIAAAGYDPLGLLDQGKITIDLGYDQWRSGRATLSIAADLADASMAPQLGWAKKIGSAGQVSATLNFQSGQLVDVPNLNASAPDMNLAGRISAKNGLIASIAISRLQLGRSDIVGTVNFPAGPQDPYRVRLRGKTIDLSSQFGHNDTNDADHGPHYTVDAAFDHALLANGKTMDHLDAVYDNDQGITRSARISLGAQKQVAITIEPGATSRHLHIVSVDAGALLAATDALSDVRGGSLVLDGNYDDSKPHHPLKGNITVDNFHMTNAPAVTKLLQAMTGYGLIAMAEGSGLAINSLKASFVYQNNLLTLENGRANNASIGFTLRGSYNMATSQMDFHGTIIPAYIFNNALSNLPLVGGLFSAEKGGGFLAANFSMTGPHDNPSVSVNPLSALTPGFLRGIFGGN